MPEYSETRIGSVSRCEPAALTWSGRRARQGDRPIDPPAVRAREDGPPHLHLVAHAVAATRRADADLGEAGFHEEGGEEIRGETVEVEVPLVLLGAVRDLTEVLEGEPPGGTLDDHRL